VPFGAPGSCHVGEITCGAANATIGTSDAKKTKNEFWKNFFIQVFWKIFEI